MIQPVILAGGSGSRLWPLSRQTYPKQFLKLEGDKTMLQRTLDRLKGIEHSPPIIICNEEHRFIVAEQLRQNNTPHNGIIVEPCARDTAPAIAIAALYTLLQGKMLQGEMLQGEMLQGEEALQDGDPQLLILAADHSITDVAAFQATITRAAVLAQPHQLLTFGVVPNCPHTGYGYIRQGEPLAQGKAYKVAKFEEKPDLKTASYYLESQEYFWNSGIFLITASTYLEELKRYQSQIYAYCEQAVEVMRKEGDFLYLHADAFQQCPAKSIDYAIMEQTDNAVVIPLDCGWNDVGSWCALWEMASKDLNGNSIKGDVYSEQTSNCYIHASEKLVGTVGVKDLIVIETKDAVLVAHQSEVQNIKQLLEQLKGNQRSEWKYHRDSYHSWGKFDSIDSGEGFEVKHITVKPGAEIAQQRHYHRAEHWIVVSGTAQVFNGSQELLLSENQSTYIPVGALHTLKNPGKIPLELIEIRSGSYLADDDITES